MTATHKDILPRVKFTAPVKSENDPRLELARKAAQVLGCDKLEKTLAAPGELLAALRRLDIHPLVRSSVSRYKEKKLKPGIWDGHKQAVVAGPIAVLLGTAAYLAFTSNHAFTVNPSALDLVVTVGGALCVIASIIMGVVTLNLIFNTDRSWRGCRKTYRWEQMDITSYERSGGTIPEFALSKAVEIKMAVPDVTLQIDRLMEYTEHAITRPRPDPFLVATLDNEFYYIDVWDEREYEATL